MSKSVTRPTPVTRIIATALLATAPLAATAQNRNCADHEDVMLRLAEGYGESRQAIALGSNNTVVEIFASLDTGTWTITVTAAGGQTCLVAAGEAYQAMTEELPNTDPGA